MTVDQSLLLAKFKLGKPNSNFLTIMKSYLFSMLCCWLCVTQQSDPGPCSSFLMRPVLKWMPQEVPSSIPKGLYKCACIIQFVILSLTRSIFLAQIKLIWHSCIPYQSFRKCMCTLLCKTFKDINLLTVAEKRDDWSHLKNGQGNDFCLPWNIMKDKWLSLNAVYNIVKRSDSLMLVKSAPIVT